MYLYVYYYIDLIQHPIQFCCEQNNVYFRIYLCPSSSRSFSFFLFTSLILKKVDLDFYEHCVYGKYKRVRFPIVGKEKKSEELELVHIDIWGPTEVSSLGGSFYYVTFIDDATRKIGLIVVETY